MVSGQKIGDYIGDQILKPLGIKHTIFPTNADFPDPHAQGYTVQDESDKEVVSANWNPSWGWAAGAMTSNLDDLEIWAPALAKGTLLKPMILLINTDEQYGELEPSTALAQAVTQVLTPDHVYNLAAAAQN